MNRLNQLSWIYLLIKREREGRKLYKEGERDTYRDGQREREREREYTGLGERGTNRQTEKEDTHREKGDMIGRDRKREREIDRERGTGRERKHQGQKYVVYLQFTVSMYNVRQR